VPTLTEITAAIREELMDAFDPDDAANAVVLRLIGLGLIEPDPNDPRNSINIEDRPPGIEGPLSKRPLIKRPAPSDIGKQGS